MKCDSCQEKATVFYTQVAEGKLKKHTFCESCAEAKGISSPEGLFMGDELIPPLPEAETVLPSPPAESLETLDECQHCGFTLNNLQKIGRLGCPECYHVFAGEIARRLPSMHKGQIHAGYIPASLMKQEVLRGELSELEKELALAISEENFEEAAKLRDQIAEFEAEKEEGTA